ncbi:hypothetical protein ElyMa_003858400 [Elysia marginata]|uniref:Uncharacterized protein n=1 Tax=Elysia marginata TaxID=1093978 RepID=A0AAV4FI67_9GAST|nr:hypothetical protein ElyMa_003858400 [Elysia marginata]
MPVDRSIEEGGSGLGELEVTEAATDQKDDVTSSPNVGNQFAWTMVFMTDMSGTSFGTVQDLGAKVLNGNTIRVLIHQDYGINTGRLIDLDSVYVSADGNQVIGSAYIYQSSTLGESTFTKIEVNTNSEVKEVSIVSGVVSTSTVTMMITWFVNSSVKSCQPGTPPPLASPSRVLSSGVDGATAYGACSVRKVFGFNVFGTCLFVSQGRWSPSLDFSLRKIDYDTEVEKVTKVDPFTGLGGNLETSSTWEETSIFADNCFDLVLDTSSSAWTDEKVTLIGILQNGHTIVVSATCFDPDALAEVSLVMEVETVAVIDNAQEQKITAFVKNFASYSGNTLNWAGVTANSEGTVQRDGDNLTCTYVHFFADQSQEFYKLTITTGIGLSPDENDLLLNYVSNGYTPRLLVQGGSGDMRYFNIEFAEIKGHDMIWLRSYRILTKPESTPHTVFHVYTFDVLNCRYFYEVNDMEQTITQPFAASAQSMTLFFEDPELFKTD